MVFDKNVRNEINNTEVKIESMKSKTMSKLKDLDELIENQMKEIEETLKNRDLLKQKVKENENKFQWIKEFITQVDDLLNI